MTSSTDSAPPVSAFRSEALVGQVALVTGASRGIGLSIAAGFAAAGARVMISSRKQDQLDRAAVSIDGEVATFAANAGEPDQGKACVEAAVERFGRLDILVNNAATNPATGDVADTDLRAFDKTIRVNLRGPLAWTSAAVDAWMGEHGGRIINVSSIGALRYERDLGIYNTSKAGLIHLTKVLAAELGPRVRVNAIAPGLVRTEFARSLWSGNEERFAKRLPLGRIGEPDDIAEVATFLASNAARWMTGQTLVVDGGALVI